MSFSTNKPEYVRLIICDSSGGRRCKVVPKDVYDSNIRGTHMVMAIMAMPIFEDVIIPGSGLNAVLRVR